MIPKRQVIALLTVTIVLLQAGCVSFESDVFTSTSATPTPEKNPTMFVQATPIPIDDKPTVDFRSISPR